MPHLHRLKYVASTRHQLCAHYESQLLPLSKRNFVVEAQWCQGLVSMKILITCLITLHDNLELKINDLKIKLESSLYFSPQKSTYITNARPTLTQRKFPTRNHDRSEEIQVIYFLSHFQIAFAFSFLWKSFRAAKTKEKLSLRSIKTSLGSRTSFPSN